MWIHVIALSTFATVTGEELKWSVPVVFAVWLLAGVAGLFPFVRTVVLLVLAMLAFPWWKAILFTVIVAGILLFLEQLGKIMVVSRR